MGVKRSDERVELGVKAKLELERRVWTKDIEYLEPVASSLSAPAPLALPASG